MATKSAHRSKSIVHKPSPSRTIPSVALGVSSLTLLAWGFIHNAAKDCGIEMLQHTQASRGIYVLQPLFQNTHVKLIVDADEDVIVYQEGNTEQMTPVTQDTDHMLLNELPHCNGEVEMIHVQPLINDQGDYEYRITHAVGHPESSFQIDKRLSPGQLRRERE